jgi:(1->4)-alpha-D-glucan 1-alpha-D-glucosylmutase
MSSLRIPTATYRLQLNQRFRFEDASDLVPYLHRLGISDLYASPVFKARKGSSHGYDVTDPTHLNPELGTETDFDALGQELRNHKMGLLLDIVPNHMAACSENPWWVDVQAKKQDSPFASFFDTDWLNFRGSGDKSTGHRRFFDIGDLIGIRVEDPRVFEATHSLIFKLVNESKVTGLRIDHIDGLYDPLEYLLRLQQQIAPHLKEEEKSPAFYIVMEKILADDETIAEEWPVFGTTGYDFASMANALFVDSGGVPALDRIYSRFIGSQVAFADVVYEKKTQVIKELFPGEVQALGQYLAYLAHENGHTTALSREELTKAVTELTACLPIYRTYIRTLEVSPQDQVYLRRATEEARRRNPDMGTLALDFLKRILTLDFPTNFTPKQQEAWLHFVLRWQQLTGAVMAKGFEDTVLYNYNRLVSLNEVGGNPASAGMSVAEFHQHNLERLKHWPHTLNATSTHDSKRSEDIRARVNVLAEIPEEWESHLTRWGRWNEPQKQLVNGLPVPEPNTEILLYQTLLGAWPFTEEEVPEFKQRLKDYMVKAVREAKTFTNWLSPNSDYESAIIAFLESILDGSKENSFLADFLQFEKRIAYYGAFNSLAQVLLKITSPGVPDFYQGMELWYFSLVDPDNRRPVDFKRRIKLMDELMRQEQPSLIKELLASWTDGRVKLYVTVKALNVRSTLKDLFSDGDYIPLQTKGTRREHVCAFVRRKGDKWALVMVPRLLTKLVRVGVIPVGRQVWGEDLLPLPDGVPEHWLNIFTGENLEVSGTRNGLPISSILSIFPVALLTSS